MELLKDKEVLISGASFAGLTTAYWMATMGCKVTIVELGSGLKMGGTPVNIKAHTFDTVRRMGIFDQIKADRLSMELVEFKNAGDETKGSMVLKGPDGELPGDEYEIERDTLLCMIYAKVKDDVKFVFSNSIVSLSEKEEKVEARFRDGLKQEFDFVFGCDGIHSAVRRLWFGNETEYSYYLGIYFSLAIVPKLLIKQYTSQFYNVPDKCIMLHAYNGKTDIGFCFRSDTEISYDFRDQQQHKEIIRSHFKGDSWRTRELLGEIMRANNFYFDKLAQIKMPSWTKGRVALVGDAGYCASPAAGLGGSLAIIGAAALAGAFEKHNGNYELAFETYNRGLRPFVEEVQKEAAVNGVEFLVPRTEEAIRQRNQHGFQ
ncbi:MAG: FAD-dependent monooxygenase [Williamsia sp.]|nr:FAD-dependent monooxygenase [Williamsia sp.]